MKTQNAIFLSLLLATVGSFTTVLSAASVDDLTFEVIYDDAGVAIAYRVADCDTIAEGVLDIPASFTGSAGTLPVTKIKDSAFLDCNHLTHVSIPDTITALPWNAFYNCTGLTSVSIPDTVTAIGGYAFWNCNSLESIIIPDGVTAINRNTFNDCRSLTSITIPGGVTDIHLYAFLGCNSLESVYFEGPAPNLGEWVFPDLPANATFYVLEEHLASYEALNLDYTLATYGSEDGSSDADNFYAVSGSYDAENDQFIIVSEGEDSALNTQVQSTDDLSSGEWTTLSSLSYLEATNTAENTVTRTISSVDATETPTRYYRLRSDSNTE